ncbi:MAG: hypothetical protein OXG34_11795 [bacterium]|nr:hypothetical protein [bacterium]
MKSPGTERAAYHHLTPGLASQFNTTLEMVAVPQLNPAAIVTQVAVPARPQPAVLPDWTAMV